MVTIYKLSWIPSQGTHHSQQGDVPHKGVKTSVTEQTRGSQESPDTVTETSPLPWGLSVTVGSLPATRNCGSQCQSLFKRKGTIYSEVYRFSKVPPMRVRARAHTHTHTHTALTPPLCPGRGTVVSGKETEVCSLARLPVPLSNPYSAGRSPAVPSTINCVATWISSS